MSSSGKYSWARVGPKSPRLPIARKRNSNLVKRKWRVTKASLASKWHKAGDNMQSDQKTGHGRRLR